MSTVSFTMLNSMADEDLDTSLRMHNEWGLHWLDLRDGIYGKWVKDLTVEEAQRAADAIEAAGLEVLCLSTSVFFGDIAEGEEAFREKHLGQLAHILTFAPLFKPKFVRLIAAQLPEREPGQPAVALLQERYPWVVDVYREAVAMIESVGLTATIENEAFRCFLSDTQDFVAFFAWLDRPSVSLTWDINNQWATGVFPTHADYEQLRPLIRYFHLKGGQVPDEGGTTLAWNSSLEDSSYDVVGITSRVISDGVSPVICLNPSQHGTDREGYDYNHLAKRDLDFLKATFEGAAS